MASCKFEDERADLERRIQAIRDELHEPEPQCELNLYEEYFLLAGQRDKEGLA